MFAYDAKHNWIGLIINMKLAQQSYYILNSTYFVRNVQSPIVLVHGVEIKNETSTDNNCGISYILN